MKKKHRKLHQLSPKWKFLGLLATVIGVFNLIGVITWFGPDPIDVVRSSSPEVPDFSHLSAEETIIKLQKIVIDPHADFRMTLVELSEDGYLRTTYESADRSYTETQRVPLAKLDQFVYAQKSVRGEFPWRVQVFCAHYQMCIKASHSRKGNRTGEYALNQDTLILKYHRDIQTALGLLNRLLEIYGAKQTIDQSKNTIRISQEYWQHP
ncbi:hypothetical protein ACSYAD_01670 [Acaryochloris marina NIES-2412]|uniref:hypothetical protein n=1 Tax=Acaryochloris marina TaxID=155978 RepID=UPI004059B25A